MAQIPIPEENQGTLPIQKFDTRSLSLGSSTIADVYGNASSSMNPALPALHETKTLLHFNSHQNWDTNLVQSYITLPTFTAGPHNITARAGIINHGLYNFDYGTTVSVPEPDVEIYHADITYAYAFSNVFSIGGLQSISFATNNRAEFWTYSADIGIAYAPEESISYGLVLRGLGHETTYQIIETGQTILGSRLQRQRLEVAATLRYPTERRTFLSISFSNEKIFSEDGLWYKGGVELLPYPFIAIRGGALVHFDQSVFIPRFGLGLNSDGLHLHYMVAPKDMMGEYFHQIGLTFQF